MPSEQEIHDLREQYPDLRVWGATRSGLTHESVLGDFPVVPFDDVIAALRACEQRARKEERGGAPVAAIELAGYSRGYAAGVQAARHAVAWLPHEDGCCSKGCACQTWDKQEPCDLSCNCSFWWKPHALAAIDALREETK